MKTITLLTAVCISVLSFAQNKRDVGDFTMVKVYDRINVELVQADQNEVDITSNNEDEVLIVNKNGELRIKMATPKIMQGEKTTLTIYYKNLTDLQASQGAVITSNSPVEGSLLNVTSNEGSKINISVDVDTINAKGNSGGEISLSGSADNQDIVMNSGAQFLGKNLDSRSASITVNAGGFAQVFANDTVETTTRAGGKIEVYGDPSHRNEKKVAGGKVEYK